MDPQPLRAPRGTLVTDEDAQTQFEECFEPETLAEPLCEQDSESLGEALMNLQADVRLLFTRARIQYGGDTWISNEMWMALQELDVIWERFQRIYDAGGFPGPNSPRTSQ